jgi:hypothetical protein
MVCVCAAKKEIKTVIIVRCECVCVCVCVCSFHSSVIDLYSCTCIRTVGPDIESTHAVHLARAQHCTDDSNYQVLRTIKHGKTYSVWPYEREESKRAKKKKKTNSAVQCHRQILDRLSSRPENMHVHTALYSSFNVCERKEILKTSRCILWMNISTPFWQQFHIHTHLDEDRVTCCIRISNVKVLDLWSSMDG